MTFGNKDMGTFTLGRHIGLFGADVILNDMTLLGVGAPGSAASAAPANTTLGGIGFGYIYTDWLAQIDYTTPDLSGFALTVGIFDPLNSLSDAGTVDPKKAPGVHAKLTLHAADRRGHQALRLRGGHYAAAGLLGAQPDAPARHDHQPVHRQRRGRLRQARRAGPGSHRLLLPCHGTGHDGAVQPR